MVADLKRDIEKCNFFSVLNDGTTDAQIKKQYISCILIHHLRGRIVSR